MLFAKRPCTYEGKFFSFAQDDTSCWVQSLILCTFGREVVACAIARMTFTAWTIFKQMYL